MSVNIFPLDTGLVSWNTTISQKWDVEEAKTASGKRRTLVKQTYPAWTFSLSFPCLHKDQIDELLGFYAKMRGKWGSFFYKDFENHHVDNVQLLKQGNNYYCSTNLATMFDPCSKVENLQVFINGVETGNYTETNGVIAFDDTVDGVVTATYDYYYLVSFGNDLAIKQIFDDAKIDNFELTEGDTLFLDISENEDNTESRRRGRENRQGRA